MKLWSKLALVLVLVCFTTVYAQNAVCTDLVEQALTMVDTACAPTGRNQACYGNLALAATPRDGVQNFSFEKQGDLANIADVATMQLQQLDLSKQTWGIALMKVQANLPDTLPGQNVTFLLFGDVRLDNDAGEGASGPTVDVTAAESSRIRTGPAPQYRVAGSLDKGQTTSASGRTADATWLLIQIPNSNSLGWVYTGYLSAAGDLTTLPVVEAGKQEVPFKPMQAFYFSTGIGKPSCTAAPDSGVLVQTPKGVGQINLRANDVDIQLGSTAFLQAQPSGSMTISVVEGEGKVTAQGKTVTVPAGTKVEIPLDQNLKADGAPSDTQPYNAASLANLPIGLLPLPITIAAPPPVTGTPFPTWTRGPRLPTATLAAQLVGPTATLEPSLEPSATATYYADSSPTAMLATAVPPTAEPPTVEPPTAVPPTAEPPVSVLATAVPPTDVPPPPDDPATEVPTGLDSGNDDGGYSGPPIEEFIEEPTSTPFYEEPTIDPELIS